MNDIFKFLLNFWAVCRIVIVFFCFRFLKMFGLLYLEVIDIIKGLYVFINFLAVFLLFCFIL